MVDYTQLTLAIRTNTDPEEVIARVKSQIWAIDKNLPLFEVRTMEQVLDEDTSQRRFESFVMSVFAGGLRASPRVDRTLRRCSRRS